MTATIENEQVLFLNDKKEPKTSKRIFYKRWWYQDYEHQNLICQIIEHNLFYKITIILLIFDCSFVFIQTIIDFTKVKSECAQKTNSVMTKYKHEIEILMKILHYLSLSILTLFVLEFLIKIYIYGRDFWNIYKRKMEYFDGFIVMFSFFFDILFLISENNYFMEHRLELLTTIRMWRMIRIINSVVQYVINEEQKKKEHFNEQYILTIEQFLHLLKYKTNCIEKKYQNAEEYFNQIDNQCQSYFNLYKETNQQIPSSNAMTQFLEELQTLETSFLINE